MYTFLTLLTAKTLPGAPCLQTAQEKHPIYPQTPSHILTAAPARLSQSPLTPVHLLCQVPRMVVLALLPSAVIHKYASRTTCPTSTPPPTPPTRQTS